MRAKELKDRTIEELKELEKRLKEEFFHACFQNHIGRLSDTSQIPKKKRDIARVKTILKKREIEK